MILSFYLLEVGGRMDLMASNFISVKETKICVTNSGSRFRVNIWRIGVFGDSEVVLFVRLYVLLISGWREFPSKIRMFWGLNDVGWGNDYVDCLIRKRRHKGRTTTIRRKDHEVRIGLRVLSVSDREGSWWRVPTEDGNWGVRGSILRRVVPSRRKPLVTVMGDRESLLWTQSRNDDRLERTDV